jgi:hypothetical protein
MWLPSSICSLAGYWLVDEHSDDGWSMSTARRRSSSLTRW